MTVRLMSMTCLLYTSDRYQMTLEEIPGIILDIRQKGALMGTSTNRIESGYLLSNGTALLENEKDENGFYVGGNYVNGEYLKSQERYEPVSYTHLSMRKIRQLTARNSCALAKRIIPKMRILLKR